MASPVSISSQALVLLGANPIASFTEPTDRARTASNLYEDRKLALLREHPWNCCIRRVILAPEVLLPGFGYRSQFLLPSDCLRVLSVGDGLSSWEDYQLEGRRILTDGTALALRYVADTEESAWDPQLVQLMTQSMVAAMAYPITKSSAVAEAAEAKFERMLRRAKAVDGQENPPEEIEDSPLLAARFGYHWGSR